MPPFTPARILAEAIKRAGLNYADLMRKGVANSRYLSEVAQGRTGISVSLCIKFEDAGLEIGPEEVEQYLPQTTGERLAMAQVMHEYRQMRAGKPLHEPKRPSQSKPRPKRKAPAKAATSA